MGLYKHNSISGGHASSMGTMSNGLDGTNTLNNFTFLQN